MAEHKGHIQTLYDMIIGVAMAEISDGRYEELRGYLEIWLERPCAFEEAKEIGDVFIDFYDLLIQHDDEEQAVTVP